MTVGSVKVTQHKGCVTKDRLCYKDLRKDRHAQPNIPQLEPFIRKSLANENHGIMRSRVLEIEASNAAVWGKTKNGDKRI